MRMRSFVLLLFLLILVFSCVERYQRYIEGICTDSNSAELFSILDAVAKVNGFIHVRTIETPLRYTISVDYERYDKSIRKKIEFKIFLKDIGEKKDQVEFLITVNAFGWERTTAESVDKSFADLISAIESQIEQSKLKIINRS